MLVANHVPKINTVVHIAPKKQHIQPSHEKSGRSGAYLCVLIHFEKVTQTQGRPVLSAKPTQPKQLTHRAPQEAAAPMQGPTAAAGHSCSSSCCASPGCVCWRRACWTRLLLLLLLLLLLRGRCWRRHALDCTREGAQISAQLLEGLQANSDCAW
jgi:hypothetical protein